MVRKTMIVLATAVALIGGGLTDAMARGGGGFGGGHIEVPLEVAHFGHMGGFPGHMGGGFGRGHLAQGFAADGHVVRGVEHGFRRGYCGWGYDYPCNYYNYAYGNYACYDPNYAWRQGSTRATDSGSVRRSAPRLASTAHESRDVANIVKTCSGTGTYHH